jgi:hypothetical protein
MALRLPVLHDLSAVPLILLSASDNKGALYFFVE